MKLSKLSQFNVILFSKIIEEIRECVASRLWHLVVVKADLISHLKSIKDYFLLAKGEFYQTFLEDARHIMTLPPTTSAQDDLNLGPLQTTISKLRLEDDAIFTRKFKLTLRNFFFVYRDFTRLTGLIYDGDIRYDQVNNCLRITSTKNSSKSGCLWHSLKQRIDLGFKTSFGFRFMNPLGASKGGVNQSMLSGSQAGTPRHGRESFAPKIGLHPGEHEVLGGDRQIIDCAVAFIIQNEKEVIPWKMKTPVSTQDLNQFIAVKFITKITIEREKYQTNRRLTVYQSNAPASISLSHYVQVVASAETNIGKIRNIVDDNELQQASKKTEVVLAEKEILPENLLLAGAEQGYMSSAFHHVLVDYSKENEQL